MKRPFVILSSSLVLGILTAYYLKLDLWLLVAILVLFISGLLISKKFELGTTYYLIFSVFLLGILVMTVSDIDTIERYTGQDLAIRGEVVSIDRLEDEYGRYVIRTESLKNDKLLIKEKYRILITTEDRTLSIGDKILFRSEVRPARENTNPLLFNQKNYLRGRSIRVTSYVKGEDLEIVGRTSNPFLGLKHKVYTRLDRSFSSLKPRNKEFLSSLISGSSLMEKNETEDFRGLGLAHILAVSGLHLASLTGFLILILTILLVDRKIANFLALFFIVAYTYIIDFSPSIMRAGIMMAIYLMSINLKRYSDPINNLFFVSFLLAIINPYIIFSLSFQLSFLASLSLLLLVAPLERLTSRNSTILWESLLAILGVQIGLLPAQAYYFNNINLLGILANLLIIPLVTIIIPLGFILFALPVKLGFLGYSLSIILDFLIDIIFYIKDYLVLIDLGKISLASPSIIGILIYYLFLASILNTKNLKGFPRSINKLVVLGLLIIFSLNLSSYNRDMGLRIEFIDVDQGDSSLVRYKNKNYLIDTGGNAFKNFDIGRNIVIPYLEKTGVKKLDGVFISHFDVDHCKSLLDIMDDIKIDKIYISYRREENSYYKAITKKARAMDIPVQLLTRGDRIKLSDNFKIDVLYPDREIDYSLSDNDLSMVLELDYAGNKTLFTGDIESVGENYLIENNLTPSYFLKVPHHGSKTSSSLDLIRASGARKAFIQLGRDNSFGHPSKEVLQRYYDEGVDIYRTDELGLVSLFIGKNDYSIVGFLRDKYSIIELVIYYRYRLVFSIAYLYFSFKLILLYRGYKELGSFEF